MNSKLFLKIIGISLAIFLIMIFRTPAVLYSEPIEKETISEENPPIYIPPDKNGEIRRREGGDSTGVNRGFTRGITRGFTRGITRGLTRGMTRGFTRGITRGYTRGITRGYTRGITRGYTRGLVRGLTRGYTRGLTRSLTRGYTRGYTRSLTRGETRESTKAQDEEKNDLIQSAKIPDFMTPIAPLRTGYTSDSQPVLSWYISDTWPGKIELIINEERGETHFFRTYLDPPVGEGVYSIDLSNHGVKLKQNVEYEWFIVIVIDPGERSGDFVGSATIKYVVPGKSFSKFAINNDQSKGFYEYAKEGYWYDAFDNLSGSINANPYNIDLRKLRSDLLKQIQMKKVATYYDDSFRND